MIKLLNTIIQKLGRKNYQIDNDISQREIIIILRERFCQIFRGYLLKYKLKSSSGLIFKGKNVRIVNSHKITTGKTLVLHDNVIINALSKEGIVFGG